jgi:hypothetical protein
MAVTGHPVQLTSREGDQVLVLRAWIGDQWLPGDGGLLSTIVLYPYDLFRSLGYALQAPFDADYDVRLGPLGALLGIALPGVSLVPAIGPSPAIQGTWVLEHETLDSLIEAAGQGRPALNQALRATTVWSEHWWYVERVELRERREGENAELLRDPDREYWFVHFDQKGGAIRSPQRL